jgi:hypothetical protein
MPDGSLIACSSGAASSLKYGLGTLSATLEQMGEITVDFAYRALPGLGVNRNILSEWRYLHSTFGGVGLLSLSTEATICRINLFLQHWDMPSPLGKMLQASMELLQLEVGCRGCPLMEQYQPIGPIVTHCWMKSFWEVLDEYKLQLTMDYPDMDFPRSNDRLIMVIAITLGLRGDDLQSINRVRMFLCAIFLSDLASANGWYFDSTRCSRDVVHSGDSIYTFPKEKPLQRDWEVCETMW